MIDKSNKMENIAKNNAKAGKANGYMTEINGLDKMSFQTLESKLESEVIAQLKSEFPGIEKTKSFSLLVDAVVNNVKNKDLKISEKRSVK